MKTDEVRRFAIETLLKAKRQEAAADTIDDATPIGAGGLGVNSLAFLQTFVIIEDRYGLTFDDASVANTRFSTVGEFVAFVSEAVGAHAARNVAQNVGGA
ncbi:acyl carrier protein [Arenibaculum sp.]|uniref:acyl carrier protein n=1 Tax=Arenibaculum sp. TaxID=2865862 RepID=UPI002E12F85A|nr:acyl carrier protein [Arenibaculum sp.]